RSGYRPASGDAAYGAAGPARPPPSPADLYDRDDGGTSPGAESVAQHAQARSGQPALGNRHHLYPDRPRHPLCRGHPGCLQQAPRWVVLRTANGGRLMHASPGDGRKGQEAKTGFGTPLGPRHAVTEHHRREIHALWSHELLTPLNAVMGALELLDME